MSDTGNAEPGVRLITEPALSITSSGLVLFRESKAFFDQVFTNLESSNVRHFEAVLAVNHETIHFLQTLTSPYLHAHAIKEVGSALSLLQHVDELASSGQDETPFESVASALRERSEGFLSVAEILEGVAVVESFNLTYPDANVIEFLRFRERFFPGDESSIYRRSFDLLAHHIGISPAYDLLAPVSFVALQRDDPAHDIKNLFRLLASLDLEHLAKASMTDFLQAFGMDGSLFWLKHLDEVKKRSSHFHPILFPAAVAAVDAIGADRLMELAGRPSRISGLDRDGADYLVPPLTAYSSSAGRKLEGTASGVARDDAELRQTAIALTSAMGAAERLTLLRRTPSIYQFCPHSDCPHHPSALCHRWYAPPSAELGYEECGFPDLFRDLTQQEPAAVWSSLPN